MYVIMTPTGYVAGFDRTFGIVQTTDDPAYMKSWKRKGDATRFLNRYSDAGYGMSKDTARVEFIEGYIAVLG